jgi:hypothetical protein
MTPLYHSIIEHANGDGPCHDLELTHKVWDPTPWVVDVYLGDRENTSTPLRQDECAIKRFCRANFGKESWPMHDEPAAWYSGGAIVDGWTWFGFDSEQKMNQFLEAWPDNSMPPDKTLISK